MQNGCSNKNGVGAGGLPDLEKQGSAPLEGNRQSLIPNSTIDSNQPAYVTIVISDGESCTAGKPVGKLSKGIESPKKGYLSRAESSHEQCRVCQQEKEEVLMDLGCQCRGGLAKAHRSCIDTWFRTRGSNKCEICQQITGFGGSTQPLVDLLLHMNVEGVVLILFGWHSQSSSAVSCWMC